MRPTSKLRQTWKARQDKLVTYFWKIEQGTCSGHSVYIYSGWPVHSQTLKTTLLLMILQSFWLKHTPIFSDFCKIVVPPIFLSLKCKQYSVNTLVESLRLFYIKCIEIAFSLTICIGPTHLHMDWYMRLWPYDFPILHSHSCFLLCVMKV